MATECIKVIATEKAPSPLGPYSQGVCAGGFVFLAGQIGLDPATKELVSGGIQTETRQTLKNIRAILEACGSGMDRVVSTSVFLANLSEFSVMNDIYAEFFSANPPGRTTIEVKSLPAGARVEITATALAG